MNRELLPLLRKACTEYVGSSTLSGCCVHVALIVQSMCGGELLRGWSEDGNQHFWNRLPDGTEVDLTSSQFGGDGFAPLFIGEVFEKPDPIPLDHLFFCGCGSGTLGGGMNTDDARRLAKQIELYPRISYREKAAKALVALADEVDRLRLKLSGVKDLSKLSDGMAFDLSDRVTDAMREK